MSCCGTSTDAAITPRQSSCTATDAAQPVVEKMEIEAKRLAGDWQKLLDRQLDVNQFRSLVMQTHAFLSDVPKQTKATNAYLMDIMMAQDFHDLTGQVIRRVVTLAQSLEEQLVKLLIETTPPELRPRLEHLQLEGPVVAPEGRDDVVADQQGVDDLLASLGF